MFFRGDLLAAAHVQGHNHVTYVDVERKEMYAARRITVFAGSVYGEHDLKDGDSTPEAAVVDRIAEALKRWI